MLNLFLLSSLVLFILPSRRINFLLVLLGLLIYYLSNINFYFCSPLVTNTDFYLNDEVSLFITLLLFFIIFISYLSRISFNAPKGIGLTLLVLFYFCFEVFNTCHLFSLYFFYEASLIPILYIIIKWGSYPERSIRAMIIISYTLLFGVPMFILIINLYILNNSWLILFISQSPQSVLTRVLIFSCFAVKLPVYGLHYWLPIAHVEAPTFGSVILASILLKLGGVGLIRILPLLDISRIKHLLMSYFIVFTIYSTVICCFQSDFKRLIAYSSVSHIMAIPLLILRNNILSIQRIVFIILLHGLSSSLIFLRVGLLYSIFASRQLVLIRGVALSSPLFSFLLTLTFFFTLSAPPFPSYFTEVYFILASYILTPYIILIFIAFIFFGLVYNLNWLTRILFSTSTNASLERFKHSYISILPFPLIFIMSFVILFLTFSL